MPDPSHESPLSPPRAASSDRQRLLNGLAIGLACGFGVALLGPIAGAAIDQWLHPGVELSGLPGLVGGAMIGGIVLLLGTAVAFAIGARRQNPFARGVARGLLVLIGVIALTAGVCAIAM